MRNGLTSAISTVALITLVVGGAARAATITESLATTVANLQGYTSTPDDLGLFGTAGASLTGDVATLSFSYDTSLLLTNAGTPQSSYEFSTAEGFEQFDGPYVNGALSVSITINSQTYTIADPTSVIVNGFGPPDDGLSLPQPGLFQVSLGGPASTAATIGFWSLTGYTIGTMFDQQAVDDYLASSDGGELVLGSGQTGLDILYFGLCARI